jgi:hypothetical protein
MTTIIGAYICLVVLVWVILVIAYFEDILDIPEIESVFDIFFYALFFPLVLCKQAMKFLIKFFTNF